jgi:hypothetical protein
VSTEQRERLESVVWRFEDAWEKGREPAIDDYLTGQSVATLVELIFAAFQRRIKAGRAPQLEAYLQRYPALADDPDLVVELVAVDYGLRRPYEPGLGPQDCVQRFPHLGRRIEDRLSGSTPAGPSPTPARTSHPPSPWARPGPAAVLARLMNGNIQDSISTKAT